MHGKNLIKKFSMSADELNRLTSDALGSTTLAELDTAIGKTVAELSPNKIVKGKVIKVQEDGTVVVDVSYKAEGHISLEEFPDPLAVVPGLHAVVFTAGIGENDATFRSEVVAPLAHLGVGTRIPVLVIPTNEELEIARETLNSLVN